MENFIYYTPTKIYFGKGEEDKVADIIKEYNPNKIMLVFGFPEERISTSHTL